jgi:hypothetical protein
MTDVYIASELPTNYPRKLQKPGNLGEGDVPDTAESMIMDSGIGDSVTNSEVLDLAEQIEADFVIGKDYLHDQDRTTESVREFLDIYATHSCEATPMIPLQPPHHEHYRDLPGFDYYVLGGMAVDEVNAADAIRYIRKAAEVIPDSADIHALGVGGKTVASELAGEGIVDSVDCSTPERAAMFGEVLNDNLQRRQILIHSGDGTRNRTTPLAEFNSWQIQDYWDRCSDEKKSVARLSDYGSGNV